eukprot:756605-Hanusia_phi.AAC.4
MTPTRDPVPYRTVAPGTAYRRYGIRRRFRGYVSPRLKDVNRPAFTSGTAVSRPRLLKRLPAGRRRSPGRIIARKSASESFELRNFTGRAQ